MCDIMPTISEDPPEIYYGQNEETNFEQLMVNMLDERDKLMETLRETQDSLSLTRAKLTDCQKEKDNLMEHLENILSQVRSGSACCQLCCMSAHPSQQAMFRKQSDVASY